MICELQALDCAIVGAGIAGLCAAIALKKASPAHQVTIYEKSRFKSEIGAAITLTPNASILDRWGFDHEQAGATAKEQSRMLHSHTLETLHRRAIGGTRDEFGAAFHAFHRADLHQALREMAEQLGARIELGRWAVDVECEGGRFKFDDGEQIVADLVVIADGMKSGFVKSIAGIDEPLIRIGKSVFRGLVPMNEVMANPIIRPIFENEPSGFCSCMSTVKGGPMVITYPCRNGQILNVAVFHTTRKNHENDEGWSSPATVEEVVDVLEGMHPVWSDIVKTTQHWACFPIAVRKPIPRYNNGHAVLIGDAAHPMQPTHAQGGAMGIEDAACLGVLFKDFQKSAEAVIKRLQLFNQIRLPRANTTQLISNAMFYTPNGTDAAAAEPMQQVRTYYSGPLLPLRFESWGKDAREFFYPYDIDSEAQKAIQYKDEEGGVPDGVMKYFY